jgi:ABC-type nitrate/sulfonate/bicarbonate transport system substrate-binding protein
MRIWARLIVAAALSWLCLQPAAAAERLVTLEVALGDVSLNKVPFLMAADAGIYARNGLDVRQFITPGAAQDARESGVEVPAQYVRSDIGSAPISVGGASPMIYRVANDAQSLHRVALMTTEGTVRNTIITTNAIARVEDLKGKRLGYSVPGAVTHVAALHFAKHMGWDPARDIALIGNGNSLNPLREGRIDGALGSAMTFSMAPELNLKLLIDLTPFNFPVGGSSVLAERNWLRMNRDTAARFVRATNEALALMRRDRAAFNAALTKWFNVRDPIVQERMYREIEEIPRKPYPAVEGIRVTLAFYDSPEMRKYKPEDFYDASFMTELDRSGFLDQLYR